MKEERARLATRMVLSEEAERMHRGGEASQAVERAFEAINSFVYCRRLSDTDITILRSLAAKAELRLPGVVRALESFLSEDHSGEFALRRHHS